MNFISRAITAIRQRIEIAYAGARQRQEEEDRLDIIMHLNATRGGDWYFDENDGKYHDGITDRSMSARVVRP